MKTTDGLQRGERPWNQMNTKPSRLRCKCYDTCAKTKFRLSAKRTSPFESAGASVQSTTGSRGVCISSSNAGYTMFEVVWRVLAIHSIRQFPFHFASRASPCAIAFQLDSTTNTARVTGWGGGEGHTKAPRHNLPGTTPAVRGHSHLDAKRLPSQAARVQVTGRKA
jgi:hypothetical protein